MKEKILNFLCFFGLHFAEEEYTKEELFGGTAYTYYCSNCGTKLYREVVDGR